MDFWVSSTGLSAKITGEVRASDTSSWTTHDVDLTLYATADHDGVRDVYRADGSFSGNDLDVDPGGFLVVD